MGHSARFAGEAAVKRWRPVAVAVLLLLPYGEIGAVCPNTRETGDDDTWAVYQCGTAFRDWSRAYFNLQEDHWDEGWGWTSCDATRAFPKMLNAEYLLTYALIDHSLGPWHNDPDYRAWAAGSVHEFRYEPEDSTDAFAAAFAGFWNTDRVEMECPSFNARSPGVRAGTMVHEATHVTYWSWDHQSNPPGSACTKDCADDWYAHSVGSIAYGTLEGGKSGHTHSMNQIQIEFLCDLSEFHESWVPFSVFNPAGAEATSRMINRIRNFPGWTCGDARPLSAPLTYSALVVAAELPLTTVVRNAGALIASVTLALQ